MTDQPRFLLGRGENLTRPGTYRNRDPGDQTEPYSLQEQREVLGQQLNQQQVSFEKLPQEACPGDVVVSMMTLHPSAYARSRFPERLLKTAGLTLVGSMPKQVKPRAGRGHDKQDGVTSTLLFVSGTRKAFGHFTRAVITGEGMDEKVANELLRIESIHAQKADDRLKGPLNKIPSPLEIVLHLGANETDAEVEEMFRVLPR